LPAAAAVRSRATVDACPTPSDKPRHAHSPDRLPVNFSLVLQRKKYQLIATAYEDWIIADYEAIDAAFNNLLKGSIEVFFLTHIEDKNLDA
jgi:hypothetical protein